MSAAAPPAPRRHALRREARLGRTDDAETRGHGAACIHHRVLRRDVASRRARSRPRTAKRDGRRRRSSSRPTSLRMTSTSRRRTGAPRRCCCLSRCPLRFRRRCPTSPSPIGGCVMRSCTSSRWRSGRGIEVVWRGSRKCCLRAPAGSALRFRRCGFFRAPRSDASASSSAVARPAGFKVSSSGRKHLNSCFASSRRRSPRLLSQ